MTSILAKHVRPGFAIAGGGLLAAIGFALLTQADAGDGLTVLVTASVVWAIGLAPVYILATDLVVTAAPPERAGAASAISETATELGGALGIAVMGSIGTLVYRRIMSEWPLSPPESVTSEAAAGARGTLGGALSAAEGLPSESATALVASARAAFTDGMTTTALVAMVSMIAVAIVAFVALRRIRPSSHAGSGQEKGPA